METEKDFAIRILREYMLNHGVRKLFISLPPKAQVSQFPVHPTFRVNLAVSGVRSQQLHNGRKDIRPGEVVLALPGSINSRGNALHREGVTMSLVFFSDYVRFVHVETDPSKSVLIPRYYHTSGGGICQAGHHLLQALRALSQNTFLDNKALCKITEYLIFVALDQLENDSPDDTSKALANYRLICIHIYENFQRDITREKVALEFKITPSHVSRLFSTFGKENFNSLLRRIRLEHASELLKNSRMTVKEIASQAGFSGASYFIQVFKAVYGISPIRFRLKRLKEQDPGE